MTDNDSSHSDSNLTPEQLTEIEQAAAAASPGPWEALIDTRVGGVWVNVARPEDDLPVALFDYRKGPANKANGSFVARARTDVARLAAEVRRLNRRIQDLLEANTREVDARVQAERQRDDLMESRSGSARLTG